MTYDYGRMRRACREAQVAAGPLKMLMWDLPQSGGLVQLERRFGIYRLLILQSSLCFGAPVKFDVTVLGVLAHAQPNAPALRVDADDPHLHRLALVHDFLGMGHAMIGQFGDC